MYRGTKQRIEINNQIHTSIMPMCAGKTSETSEPVGADRLL